MKPSQLRARYWRIVFFFGRVTANFILWEIVLPRLGMRGWSSRTRSERYRRIAVRFRALAIRMGGLMIKVGQFLSARLDVLPPEITDELSGLQDEVPAEPFSAIREQAESELGATLASRYAWIDDEPLAAASLGQVHRARLCEAEVEQHGFENVVVKVQRPHIEQIVEVDLAALRRVGGWLAQLQAGRQAGRRARARRGVRRHDARGDRLRRRGAQRRRVSRELRREPAHPHPAGGLGPQHAPRAHARGRLGDQDRRLRRHHRCRHRPRRGRLGACSTPTCSRSSTDGFFHADPHPGNLFVTPTGDARDDGSADWQLTFVDFGMVGRVPDNLRDGLREVLVAVGTQDAARLVASFKTLDVLLPSADLKLIERASGQLFDRFWGMSMSELKGIDHDEMMRFGLQFRELMLELPFQLPQNLLMLGRTVGLLSGMCTGLDAEFNLWNGISPYATKLISDEGGSNWQTWLAEGTKILQTAHRPARPSGPRALDRRTRRTQRADAHARPARAGGWSAPSAGWQPRSCSQRCSSQAPSSTPQTPCSGSG